MIILQPDTSRENHLYPDAIAIFGLGLLGGAIYKNVDKQLCHSRGEKYDYDWYEKSSRRNQTEIIFNELGNILKGIDSKNPRIAMVWSAGITGFSCQRNDIEVELDNYKSVIDLSNTIKDKYPESVVEFHLLSSAGGIFEGSGYVDLDTSPQPLRPYGELKLKQEELLSKENGLVSSIYRPSTVYGPIGAGTRSGLVSTLIRNGVLKFVTNILGHLQTLRDYVYSEDIGRFIANSILSNREDTTNNIYHLFSGKPTSIYEIISVVEFMLKQRLYYKLEYNPSNSCDIIFSPSLQPFNWSSTNIELGCQQILQNWQSSVA